MTSRPSSYGPLGIAVVLTLALASWGADQAQAGPRSSRSASQTTLAAPADPASAAVRISQHEFDQFKREGNVVLVDVRSGRAYLNAHLPDAVSIPLEKLEGSLARLRAANTRIVLYCGGDAAMKSGRAAVLLRAHGFEHVYCLDGGFERWVATGRVVVVQPSET